MNFFKKPGRILLTIMLVLAVVCPYRVTIYKTKIEEIQSGKLQIDDMQYAASDLHPYSANGNTIYDYRSYIRFLILCKNQRFIKLSDLSWNQKRWTTIRIKSNQRMCIYDMNLDIVLIVLNWIHSIFISRKISRFIRFFWNSALFLFL